MFSRKQLDRLFKFYVFRNIKITFKKGNKQVPTNSYIIKSLGNNCDHSIHSRNRDQITFTLFNLSFCNFEANYKSDQVESQSPGKPQTNTTLAGEQNKFSHLTHSFLALQLALLHQTSLHMVMYVVNQGTWTTLYVGENWDSDYFQQFKSCAQRSQVKHNSPIYTCLSVCL